MNEWGLIYTVHTYVYIHRNTSDIPATADEVRLTLGITQFSSNKEGQQFFWNKKILLIWWQGKKLMMTKTLFPIMSHIIIGQPHLQPKVGYFTQSQLQMPDFGLLYRDLFWHDQIIDGEEAKERGQTRKEDRFITETQVNNRNRLITGRLHKSKHPIEWISLHQG